MPTSKASVRVGDTIKLTGKVVNIRDNKKVEIRFTDTAYDVAFEQEALAHAELICPPLSIPSDVVEAIKEFIGEPEGSGTLADYYFSRDKLREFLESHRAKE